MKVGILVENSHIGYFSKRYLELFALCGHEVQFIKVKTMTISENKKSILCKDSFSKTSRNNDIIFSMIGIDLLKEVLSSIYYDFKDDKYPLFITNINDTKFYRDKTFVPDNLIDRKIRQIVEELDAQYNYFNEDIKISRAFYNVTPDLLDYRNEINSNIGIIGLANRICGDLSLYQPFFDSLKKEDINVLDIRDTMELIKDMPWIIQQSVLSKSLLLKNK